MDKKILINKGLICPYCERKTHFQMTNIGTNIYICHDCRAWVGCYRGTNNALGRLAKDDLRKLKIEAHNEFDKHWKSGKYKRREMYRWLSEKMNLPQHETHIGMFDEEQCRRCIELCRNPNLTI